MRTLSTALCTLLLCAVCSSSASAQNLGERIKVLREAAQFDRARAAEFRKFANEDSGVAQARERQAQDLDNNANRYAERANFHRSLAAQFGNNPDQVRLANECQSLANELHKMANERRNIVGTLRAHVNNYNSWASSLEGRAASYENQANMLQSAGRL